MIQPRDLKESDDYLASLDAERAKNRPRFNHHLKTLRVAAMAPPHGSRETPTRNRRVAETTDEAHGYVVFLIFDLDPQHAFSTLLWIESYDP